MTALLHPRETLTLGINVIVRPGDPCTDWRLPDFNRFVTPQDWVALTGPCPTCDGGGAGWTHGDSCPADGCVYGVCPDCRDGRRIVPLYTDCPQLDVHFAGDVDGWDECFYGCDDQHRVLVGRGSIEVVPVVADIDEYPDPIACIDIAPHGYCSYWPEGATELGEETPLGILIPSPVPGRDFGIVIDCVELAP